MTINNITFTQDYPIACNNVKSGIPFAGKIKEKAADQFIKSSSTPTIQNNSSNKSTMNCLVGGILIALAAGPVTSLVGGFLLGYGAVDMLVGKFRKGTIL